MEIARRLALALLLAFGSSFVDAATAAAQAEPGDDEAAVLAVVDSALVLISAEDFVGFTALKLEEAPAFISFEREDGGGPDYAYRSPAAQQSQTTDADYVERGFEPVVQVAGHLASVWLPYDFYTNGEWSHCGVDVFILLRTDEGWRIASLAWTIEQPPACRPHPDGPPSG